MSDENDIEEEAAGLEEDVNEILYNMRKRVQANPYQYDAHIEYINALKKADKVQDLQHARTKMSETFPLTEELWKAWIEDEKLTAEDTIEDKKKIVNLYERSLVDYLSVDLWCDYLRYVLEEMYSDETDVDEKKNHETSEGKMGVREIRQLFEKALTVVGLHFTEGYKIWKSYISFEKVLLEDSQNEKREEHIRLIRNIYHRWLAVPQESFNENIGSYIEWESETNPDNAEKELLGLKQLIEKTSLAANEKLPYEEALQEENNPNSLVSFFSYATYEQKRKPLDPFAVRIIFERAIKYHCLVPTVWEKYTFFLDAHFNVESVVLLVHERAIRNCPWASDLWASYLRALERFKSDPQIIEDTYFKGLNAGAQTINDLVHIHLAYLDYRRRALFNSNQNPKREDVVANDLFTAFDRALGHISQYFVGGDPYFQIERYRAKLEIFTFQNYQNGKKIYEDILNSNSTIVEIWLEYINFERIYGEKSNVSGLFKRATVSHPDWPEKLFNEWIIYEREFGNLESYNVAKEKIHVQSEILEEKRAREQQRVVEQQEQQDKKRKGGKGAELPKKKKGKTDENQEEGAEGEGKKRKEKKRDNQEQEEGEQEEKTDQSGVFKMPAKKNKKQPETDHMDVDSDSREHTINPYDSEDTRDHTVFLSNLAFSADKQKLFDKFKECGDIRSIRLQVDKQGNSKGFAHVEFLEKESVEKALKKDREFIDGRPVYVSRWVNKKKGEKAPLSYADDERKVLYVSNLPFNTDEDDLKPIFSPYEGFEEIRLVRKKSGESRRFAYVEYKNEEQARAVLKEDGRELGGINIRVELSKPKKKSESNASAELLSFGRTKNALSMVPRQMATKKEPKVEKSTTDSNSNNTKTNNGNDASSSGGSKGSKSNEDFRKMLFLAKDKSNE